MSGGEGSMTRYVVEAPLRPDFAALAVEEAYRVNGQAVLDALDSSSAGVRHES